MGRDDSMNYKLDSGIEALARGAVGATLGSIVGLGVGFMPVLVPMLGLALPWGRDAQPMTTGLWFVSAIGLGSVAGATFYLRRGQ
jgi:hypothetical protein